MTNRAGRCLALATLLVATAAAAPAGALAAALDATRGADEVGAAESSAQVIRGEGRPEFSGVYPHLAHFNSASECGTGVVVPWSDRLWVVTYAPHCPDGSDDKLYEITAELDRVTRSESVGGTPANRMIHRESGQLFIGPYAIDRQRRIRVITPRDMPGRLTGNARHLTDPRNKIYFATMEEGLYEVDVHSLNVATLFADANGPAAGGMGGKRLPGCHGKGLYSGQGRLVYANNGEPSRQALTQPNIPSGVLASWDGSQWTVVRRNQFTEVTGPGGLNGNTHPDRDPIWSIGWDHRSLILMLLDQGKWSTFRLPKASHAYDGAHGWNTEWPRIRDIGEADLLMTMHGMFWRFPRTFSAGQTAGIAPRSTYLKVVGDFCRWHNRIVLGCDDTARSEFLNRRKSKGSLAGPAQSQSNLWFVAPRQLDRFGPPFAHGGVWVEDRVEAGVVSDAFLFDAFQRRSVHLVHNAGQQVVFRFEVDRLGDGHWRPLCNIPVPASGYCFTRFSADQAGAWVRVAVDTDCTATAWFECSNVDRRTTTPAARFAGLARATGSDLRGGLLRAGTQQRGLQVLAMRIDESGGVADGYYELAPDLKLRPVESPDLAKWMAQEVAIPQQVVQLAENSVLFVDQQGRRFHLPIGNPAYRGMPWLVDQQRVDREVCTERDLFHTAGTFFELPAQNAGGYAKIRPIATHRLFVHDYCSWRGLLVLTGVAADTSPGNGHIVRSADGRCGVWLGAVDDLWALGKPVGRGGPWQATPVQAGVASDPYLMGGYDRKHLTLSHQARQSLRVELQIDVTGTGLWQTYRTLEVSPDTQTKYKFPDGMNAYWIRFVTSADAVMTAELQYE